MFCLKYSHNEFSKYKVVVSVVPTTVVFMIAGVKINFFFRTENMADEEREKNFETSAPARGTVEKYISMLNKRPAASLTFVSLK